jgi:23S rRNA pseudouridine1911/1915/1917 synthase
VGDRQYGAGAHPPLPVPVQRQLLHAAQLVLTQPATGKRLEFNAPPPADMANLLQALRATRNI